MMNSSQQLFIICLWSSFFIKSSVSLEFLSVPNWFWQTAKGYWTSSVSNFKHSLLEHFQSLLSHFRPEPPRAHCSYWRHICHLHSCGENAPGGPLTHTGIRNERFHHFGGNKQPPTLIKRKQKARKLLVVGYQFLLNWKKVQIKQLFKLVLKKYFATAHCKDVLHSCTVHVHCYTLQTNASNTVLQLGRSGL